MSNARARRLTSAQPRVLTRRYWNDVEQLRGGNDEDLWIRAAEDTIVRRFARKWRRHLPASLNALARERGTSVSQFERQLIREQLRLSIAGMEELLLQWPSVHQGETRGRKRQHVPAAHLRGGAPPLTADELKAGVLRVPDRWLEDPATIDADLDAYMRALERDVLNQLDAKLRAEHRDRARNRTLLTDPEATLDESNSTVIPMVAAWTELAAMLDARARDGRKRPDREAAARLAAKIRAHLDGEAVRFERRDRELMRRMVRAGPCMTRDGEAQRQRATTAREG